MSRKELLARVCSEQIIGIIREESIESATAVATTFAQNGIGIIEVTMTTPDAIDLMAVLARKFADDGVLIAAGTVRSTNDAAMARRAGASIIVSPHTDLRVIEYANENDLLSVAGAATPTEIVHAWSAGADVVKIYPAVHLGGADYIRTIRGPIRDVPMLAGGPVPLDAIDGYLDAGCIAVNLGPSLAVPELVANGNWEEIGRRAVLARSIVTSRRAARSTDGTYVH